MKMSDSTEIICISEDVVVVEDEDKRVTDVENVENLSESKLGVDAGDIIRADIKLESGQENTENGVQENAQQVTDVEIQENSAHDILDSPDPEIHENGNDAEDDCVEIKMEPPTSQYEPCSGSRAFGSVLSEVRNLYTITNRRDYDEMVRNIDNCQSFLKVGVCPEYTTCQYHHLRYENSPTIQIKNLFKSTCLDESPVELPSVLTSILKATSAKVESGSEKRLNREYKKFYENIIVKFRAAGTITMFKCCRNSSPHLKGNIYVRYSSHEHAARALNMYNGFLYNGRELEVEYCSVTNWKTTLCGLHDKDQTCPQGTSCTLIHAFSNPRDEYVGRRTDRWDDSQMYPQIFRRIIKCKKKKSIASMIGPKVEEFFEPKKEEKEVEDGECGEESYEQQMEDPKNCKFFMKVGSCLYGDSCSRRHVMRPQTPTIVIRRFFQHPYLGILSTSLFRDAEQESQLQIAYKKFYDDVLERFRTAGKVVMFKGCRNGNEHLRGNVYVQYESHKNALEAVERFNGSLYQGRAIKVTLAPITNWLSAICGHFEDEGCNRKNCNFLHVFHNPGGEYQGRVALNQDCQSVFKDSFRYGERFKKRNYKDGRDRDDNRSKPRGWTQQISGRNVFNNDNISQSEDEDDDRHDRRSKRRSSRSSSHARTRSRTHSRSRSKSPRNRNTRSHSKSSTHSKSSSHSSSRHHQSSSRDRNSDSQSSSRERRKRLPDQTLWKSEQYKIHLDENR